MSPLATISGTMLTPGVSRNNRLYTKDLIGSAVERMRGRIDDPDALPVVMRTHHGAGDNTRAIVGRVTGVDVDESGTARYTATLYDTAAGRDLLAQISGKDPAFRNTSIFGYWDGPAKQVEHDGKTVETGDGLDIEAIDFTAFPGVPSARVDTVRTGSPRESAMERHVVTESLETPVIEVDEAEMTAKAINDLPDSAFALIEPGGKKDADGKTVPRSKRHFPIHDKAHVRNALARAPQSPFGAKAMPKILAAAKKFGIKTADDKKESAVPDAPIGETNLSEVTEYFGDDGDAGFCIDAYNGPLCITLRAPCIDPSGLRAVATAAMNAALDALQAMDPDMDADIDVPGAPDADTDGDMGERADDNDMETVEAEEPTEVEPEPDPEAESTLPPVNVTPKQLAERLARRKTAPTPEAPKPVNPAQLATPVADQATETQTTPTDPAGDNQMEEAVVADTTTQAVETAAPDTDTQPAETAETPEATVEAKQPAAVAITGDDIKGIVAAAVEAALKHQPQPQPPAPAAEPAPETQTTESTETTSPEPAAETTPVATETSLAENTLKAAVNEAVQAATEKAVRDAIPTILDAYGLPRRKGFRTTEEAKEEMSRDDMWNNRADIFLGDYGKPA